MALTCSSRFSVLRLEDEDISAQNSQKSKQNSKNKVGATLKTPAGASEAKPKTKKKKKAATDVAELQNLAFGNGKSKTKGGGPHASQTSKLANAKQWEEWQKKDNDFVSETYEQDLQQALLLSRIDFEEKKDIYNAIQKEVVQEKTLTQAQKKKKKTNNQKKDKGTMSLDEFQGMSQPGNTNKINSLDDFSISENLDAKKETDFFDKLEEDVEKILDKENRQDIFKKMEKRVSAPAVDALNLQYREELLKKDEEMEVLRSEVEKLKEELMVVKTRNKKLCNIVSTGEMREKAEMLVEIEQLTGVKDELTEQVNEFHASLEQERSKVHSLQQELKKFQCNRREHKDSK